MAIDRSKFSGAKVSTLKDAQKSAKENDKNFSNREGRVGFHSVDDGKNVFRILPPHEPTGASYLPKRTAMLKCEVPEYKDGEETGKTEIKNKNIFVATQHGGLPKDPIELYIEYVRRRASDEFGDKDDRQKFLSPITGFRDKKGNWNWGITPKTSFVCYAVKDGKVGRLELFEAWVKEMDKLAISEDADDVIAVDPFSDPNEGFPLVITKGSEKDKSGKDKTTYAITKDEPSRIRRESWEDFFARVMVTDEQLEELIKQDPLSALYGRDVYSKRDWDLAIDGLTRFDNENKYGIFENSEFLDEIQELEKLVPEPKDKEEKEQKKGEDIKGMFNKGSEVDTSKNSGNEEEEASPEEMKFELKRFIKKQFGEQYVNQIPTGSKLSIWYGIFKEGDDLPIVMDEVKKVEPKVEETVKQTESTAVAEDDLSSEIQKLRQRRKNAQQ